MAEREGQQFGNYRLTRRLGQGAFAEVYLAEQVYLGTQAALKVLHTQLASASEIEQFRLEARTIATLAHPQIVRVLDFGVQEGTPYLLMDYAPNGSLRQKFPAGTPLAPATILPYVRQVAEALSYAHEQRLIHRDVKPENMLLGRSNEVLLSDFGIALVAQTSSAQGTQPIAGTAAYMAPEQVQGKPRPASDQYALGVVVYEWLCGARPFQGTFTEIASQQVLALPPPLRQRVPTLSPAIEQVVLRALAKDPRARFASTRAFANALEQAIAGEGPQAFATRMQTPPDLPGSAVQVGPGQPSVFAAQTVISTYPDQPAPPAGGSGPAAFPPPAAGYPDGSVGYPPAVQGVWAATTPAASPPSAETYASLVPAPARPLEPAPGQPSPGGGISRRTVVIAGAAGLALIGGGAAAAVLLSPKTPGAPSIGLGQTPTTTGTTTSTATTTATETPTETPTSSTPQPGDTLYTYRNHTQEVAALAWSPNGSQIVSGSFDHTARVWNATNGQTTVNYRRHSDQVWAVAWSPNGARIASGSRDKSVQVWDARAGTLLSNYTGHSGEIAGVAWSPDSKNIASASYDNTVRVWVALSQQFITTLNHNDHVWAVAWSPDGNYIASGSKDQTVHLWDPTNGNVLLVYGGHSDGVAAVAWSPNGKRIASGSYDRTVQVWDALTGANVVTYRGHANAVTGVAWSPDGTYIASSSSDGTVPVWKASDAARLLVYSKHGSAVEAVGWASGGQRLASASADQTVQVWLAP